ncbi:MAG TPA: hypothetical protein VH914_20960 [Acidimicrobiia bacterium]|jgi:hypothetical protein|nr:hypothetical protein [Acidimicrobiia bacterium]
MANRKRNKRGGRARKPSTRDFWGVEHDDEETIELIRPSEDPTAMIRSLGPPPLPSRETVAEHYFVAVYEKATALATALAAASDLLDMGDD